MTQSSFDRLLRASRLARDAIGADRFSASRRLDAPPADRDQLQGKVKEGGGRSRPGGAGKLKALAKSWATQKNRSVGTRASKGSADGAISSFDRRQRAITKVHYFNHAGGGGAALQAHARYVARDAAGRDDLSSLQGGADGGASSAEPSSTAHAEYLTRSRQAETLVFYDGTSDRVDGAARAEDWARRDKRHFRVILSAENAARVPDLKAYTREVMARAELALGTKLQWVAVDHHDTDNPHTHLIIRGRRGNGQDLIIPRDFIKYGFASTARDVATEWLGPRTREDARLALERDVVRHGPSRLDRMIAAQLPESGVVRVAALAAPNGDAATTSALKARANELQRLGLAHETKRNVLAFERGWQDKLKAMELHLDIRKRVVRERRLAAQRGPERDLAKVLRGVLGR